ncbi:unnamed protein product [Schistocephalus solidus]|uniref:DHC_N1 domain-containing protein n=1 Tax=Schistocephalus solidus TaxID=70667 RepID=A0A183TFC5_SCHSO|nr:unnamed protein product [Schistocephalus solidus]
MLVYTTGCLFQEVKMIHPPPTWWAGAPPATATATASMVMGVSGFGQGDLLPATTPTGPPALTATSGGSSYPKFDISQLQNAGDQIEVEYAPVYEVNFDSKVWASIAEAARMEVCGLSVPELSRLLSLRCGYYQKIVLQLQDIVDRYEYVRRHLTPIKASLLDEILKDITILFDRGVNYLNWDSLAIDDFLEQAEKEYMDYAESTREKDMEELATTVQSMLKNSLSKLEEALYDTNTNRCKKMSVVYQMFEQRILEALVNVRTSKPPTNILLLEFCCLQATVQEQSF